MRTSPRAPAAGGGQPQASPAPAPSPGPAWLVAAPTEAHPPVTRLRSCVGGRLAKRRPHIHHRPGIADPVPASFAGGPVAEHLALRGWCLRGRAPAVTWKWPASPRPAPHDVTGGPDPGECGPRDSKPKSQWLSREECPVLRVRSTERPRPRQLSGSRGQQGASTERHRIHSGRGGNGGSHGRAGHRGDEPPPWP